MSKDHWTLSKVARVLTTFIAFVALMSSVVTVVLESSASASGTVTEVGAPFPYSGESSGVNSLTVVSQHVGDLLIFSSQIHSQSITVTGVASTGTGTTGTWNLAQRYVDTTNGVITEEVWWAVVTATGSTTITATYSSSIAGLSQGPELVVDSFTAATPAGSVWGVVAGNGAAGASTSTITFPNVTTGTATSELYWGYAESTGTAVAGSIAGFTYKTTGAGNLIASDVTLGTSTAYAPTATETGGTNNTSIAAIFVDNTPSPATDTVSFNSESGTVASSISGPNSSTINLPPAPTYAGYTFNGWFTAPTSGTLVGVGGASYALTGSPILYAQWTPNTGETVTYNGNGFTGGSVPTDANSYTTGATVTVKANSGALVETGYTFNDWNTQALGGGTPYAGGATFTISANTILYAQWTLNGGGSGSGGGGTTLNSLNISASSLNVTVGGTISPTAAVSGLSTGDTATVAGVTFTYAGTGSTVYAASTTAPSAAGTYSVTPSAGTVTISPSADASKYSATYTYVAGSLVISPVVVVVTVPVPHASRIVGSIVVGESRTVTIIGTGFATGSHVRSNESGAVVRVRSVSATRIVLSVTVRKGQRPARHVFIITAASVATCRIAYVTK
jgi:uncharacterized repeat protein (TIGR02543 family)